MRPRYLSLAEVAKLTGRHPELLRQWCAAGRLPCERIGGSWTILDEHVPLVESQPARGRRATRAAGSAASGGERRVVVAAAFADAARGRLVHAEARRRFALDTDEVEIAPIALDGAEIALVAGRFPAERAPEVADLMRGLGGRILADLDQPWPLPASVGRDASRSTPGEPAGVPRNR